MRRYSLAILLAVSFAGASWSQIISLDDPPQRYKPKQPPTRREVELRESLYQYVAGLQHERAERFAEALKAFEEAARLDSESPALIKAQVPILIAMDRLPDALAACKKVVALNPDDYLIWYVQAKLHKARINYPEAIAALESGLKSETLKEHPEATQQLYFELGTLFESSDKFGPAADAFNKSAAILEHPDTIAAKGHIPREAVLARAAETYEKIGLLYRKAKQYDQAIAAFAKAQERAPDSAGRLSFVMAQIAEEAGNLKQALAHVDAYLRTQPLGLEPYEMKLDLLRRLKQLDAIVPWLEGAAQRDRFNNALQLLLAKEYVVAKQAGKAETIYKKLAEDSPSPELYRGLFRVYMDEGSAGMTRVLGMLDKVMDKAAHSDGPTPIGTIQHAKAMILALREDGELARKLVETASRQLNGKNELKFDTIYFLAVLADRYKKTDESERFYRLCLKDQKALEGNEALIYNGLLRALSKARKHEAVVEFCQQGLKTATKTPPVLFYGDLARALASLHRYDDALKNADLGIKQAGGSELVFQILRVRILAMAERHDDAESECQALLKTHNRPGEVVELRYLLSNVYSGAKQQAKAETQLQLILKVDPDNPTVNNDLGYLWADQGKNLETAEEMIRRALDADRSQRRRNLNLIPEDDKDNAAYVDSLGWVLFRRGQIEEAKKELERATTLGDNDDPVIYEHLGDVYSRLKMRSEASRAWQRSLELYKDGIRGKDEERVRDIERKLNEVKQEIGGR